MNKFIKEQLDHCKYANIIEKDSNTVLIKGARGKLELVSGNYYYIELESYIVNPPPGYDVHINWNNNTKPSGEKMKVEIIRKYGNMIQIQGTCEVDNSFWVGWVPEGSIKNAREILTK